MPNTKPKVLIDIDGCIYPFSTAARYLLHLHGVDVPVRQCAYWGELEDAVGKEHMDWLWGEGRRELFDSSQPYPGSIRALHIIEQHARLKLVTHRPLDIAHVTMGWLARYKINPYELIHASGEPKSVYAKGCIMAMDDNSENAREIADGTGLPVWVPNRAWNEDIGDQLDDNHARDIRKFDGWAEVSDWVQETTQVAA